MTPPRLEFLTAEDLALLERDARSRTYAQGEVVIAEGVVPDALFLIRDGTVYVQHEGVTVACRGPGEILGEISFLEQRGASASAVAAGEARIDRLDVATLRSRLSAHPDFAARFYRSLAVRLSERLRETSHMLSRLRGDLQSGRLHAHRASAGQLTAPLIAPELAEAMSSIRRDVRGAEAALQARSLSASAAQEAINAACESIVAELVEHTGDADLLELGYRDLLAFRDPEHLREGVGGYVFRESFALLMRSTTLARCYAKPAGVPEDHETMQAIYDADPLGDGAIGPLVDRWFLDRPFCRMRRGVRQVMAERLSTLVAAHEQSVHLCDLASGTARVLFDVLATEPGTRIHATCIDVDPDALRLSASEAAAASDLTIAGRMAFINADVATLRASSNIQLAPQHMIYGVGLLEYFSDEDVVDLLDWCHDHLAPGGTALFSQLSSTNPDLPLLVHIVQWRLHPRDEAALAALCARSAFGSTAEIATVEDGNALLMAIEVADTGLTKP